MLKLKSSIFFPKLIELDAIVCLDLCTLVYIMMPLYMYECVHIAKQIDNR